MHRIIFLKLSKLIKNINIKKSIVNLVILKLNKAAIKYIKFLDINIKIAKKYSTY